MNSISWEQYLTLQLNSKDKRQLITEHYHISACNHKQLFKRLNMMNITYKELKEIV
jgi:ribonuclease M5